MKLRYLTAGESHGQGLFGILEGIPSGLEISSSYIHEELKRRKLGFGRGDRQKIETDQVEILSGVRGGLTLGSPICLGIWNKDWENWKETMRVDSSESDSLSVESSLRQVHVPRPGHADLIGGIKYAHGDMRNVLERASARETAIRVGLGAIARALLHQVAGVEISSRVVGIGPQRDLEPSQGYSNQEVDQSSVRCLNQEAEERMILAIQRAQAEGDTLGGEFEVMARGLPAGLGSYVQWDRRLEAEISKAVLSLNAIKGVEIGLGFEAGRLPGSELHDELLPGSKPLTVRHGSNRSGGIEGGMSTGQPLWLRAAMKPLSTLKQSLRSVDMKTGMEHAAHFERSDVCAVPAAAVISESLLALVLADFLLDKFGGDSLQELLPRVRSWNEFVPLDLGPRAQEGSNPAQKRAGE
jgi:chorismate synthase